MVLPHYVQAVCAQHLMIISEHPGATSEQLLLTACLESLYENWQHLVLQPDKKMLKARARNRLASSCPQRHSRRASSYLVYHCVVRDAKNIQLVLCLQGEEA